MRQKQLDAIARKEWLTPQRYLLATQPHRVRPWWRRLWWRLTK